MIVFKNVRKDYSNGTKALRDIDFSIEQGEFVFIIGSSGAGKSSIAKIITCEEEVTAGEVLVNNYNLCTIRQKDVPALRRTIGVVFQDFRLIPDKTVFENVAFAMRVVGASNGQIRKKVPIVLGLVGLGHKVKAFPGELSGGEQQRVALARAIVNNPSVILADEPTGNLDPGMSLEIMHLLAEINARGTTVIVVTHEKDLVNLMKRRVIVLDRGRLVCDRTGGYENARK
jgi:cell division transport system ATP-binding protein